MAAAASLSSVGESRCPCRAQGPSPRGRRISLHRSRCLQIQRRRYARWTNPEKSITACISKSPGPVLSPFAGRAQSRLACLTRTASRLCRRSAFKIDNRELIVGDVLGIVCFCLYKQITALLFLPDFPGWLAPLHFNPVRFEELAIFILTLNVSWVTACGIVGGYRTHATRDLPTALTRVSAAWLIAMPVAACNLILVTAAEDGVFVGEAGFGRVLPLAARGFGEPFVTAAGVLGLMAVWRSFYTVYLDFWNVRTTHGSSVNRYQDMCYFTEALRSAFLLCIGFNVVLQFTASTLGEEKIELMVDTFLKAAVAAVPFAGSLN
ncbi:g1934 [Coccomyxa viridis]|uniref:G1934 protein n=1 Tax=Coccomyxa viridis TaxID=1274662 RepID=A0ABP1FJ56_9CHLO